MLLCLNVSYLLPVCINISYHNIAYSTNNVKFNDLYTPEALLMIIDSSALIKIPRSACTYLYERVIHHAKKSLLL